MFHQVFICDASEGATVPNDEMLPETDDIKPEPVPCKDEIENMEVNIEELKVEPKPLVTELMDYKEVPIKQEPFVEEEQPTQILPDLVPAEEDEIVKRKYSLQKRKRQKDKNKELNQTVFNQKGITLNYEKDTNDSTRETEIISTIRETPNTTQVTKDFAVVEFEQSSNMLNDVKQVQTFADIVETEHGFSKLQQNKTPVVLLERYSGEYIAPDITNFEHIEINSRIFVKEETCAVPSPPSTPHSDGGSGSDWEQEYSHSLDDSLNKKSKIKKKNLHLLSVLNKACADKLNNDERFHSKQKPLRNKSLSRFEKTENYKEHKNISTSRNPCTETVGKKRLEQSNMDEHKVKRCKRQTSFQLFNNCFKNTMQFDSSNSKVTSNKQIKEQNQEIVDESLQVSEHVVDLEKGSIFCKDLIICKKCTKIFKSKNHYNHHLYHSFCRGYRRKPLHQCDLCGKLFPSPEKLQDHKNSHTNARPHKCVDCDKYFNSKGARTMHHKSMHQNKKVRFLCCFCGIISHELAHLLAHEESHRLPEGADIPKPFKCLKCDKGFISRFKLVRHNREHKLKKCPQCSEEFATDTPLRKHLEDVHGIVKVYPCNLCSMTFNNSTGLRAHKKNHSTVLNFFCDVCDKGFKKKHQIEQHMVTHSDERPIACPKCDERFKRKTHLKQHLNSAHGDGVKPRKTSKRSS